MPLTFQAGTANCGNQTLGKEACKKLLESANSNGMLVLNCQETQVNDTLSELRKLNKELGLKIIASDLRRTVTKWDSGLNTGMATIVIYNPRLYPSVKFEKGSTKTAKSGKFNKGAVIHNLLVEDKNRDRFELQTVAGHLDSNSQQQRVREYNAIRSVVNPQLETWGDLVKTIPHAVVSGIDMNTRSVLTSSCETKDTMSDERSGETKDAVSDERFSETKDAISDEGFGNPGKTESKEGLAVSNLYHNTKVLHGRIGPYIKAPLGPGWSAKDTYKQKLDQKTGKLQDKVYKEEIKAARKNEVNGGSLDFVTVQNNSSAQSLAKNPLQRYQEAALNLPVEIGTERDHNVIVSSPITINRVEDFDRVKNHIANQLKEAYPDIAAKIASWTDCPRARFNLVNIYKEVLAPNGALNEAIANISAKDQDVAKLVFPDTALQFVNDITTQDWRADLKTIKNEGANDVNETGFDISGP